MSTKAQLREAIKREGRIKAGANLDSLVDDIVTDIMRDYCNLARYHEILKEGIPIVLVANQQSYNLPADYGNLAVVRFGRGPNPTTFHDILPQPETVRQTWRGGWPRFYRLIAGPKISFWPFYDIVVADQVLIDYYMDPASLYTLDASVFPIPRLESAVKKDAIARVQRFHSDSKGSQMSKADSAASFSAADGSS